VARDRSLPQFRQLCRQVHRELAAPAAPRFVNWYEAIAAGAARFTFDLSREPELEGVPA